jgi:hypothetical protein
MGTRSTVKFISEFDQDQPLASIYEQWDGYITGVGHDLADFLKDKKMINGIQSYQTARAGYANGMGCLAAQYIAKIKDDIGSVYMTTPDDTQEYNYEVRLIEGKLIIKVDDIFEGTPEELLNFKEQDNE